MDIFCLADSVHPIRCLSLLCWIPPSSVMDDVICLDQCQPYASHLWRKNYRIETLGISETTDYVLPSIFQSLRTSLTGHLPVQNVYINSEIELNHSLEQILHVETSCKQEHFLAKLANLANQCDGFC